MEIGQRLKQARLEKGLSQRALCGDVITRNMLSRIENGAARPSMDTLKHLAQMLDMPVAYFLGEDVTADPLATAREAFLAKKFQDVPALLGDADCPERWHMEALAYGSLAQQAVRENKLPYGCQLLEKALAAGEKTPYFTEEDKRKLWLLFCQADPVNVAKYVENLPPLTEELLARAKAAPMEEKQKWLALTDSAEAQLLQGQLLLRQGDHTAAAECFHRAEKAYPNQAAEGLEVCYRELRNFEKAYFYACKRRENG